MPEVKLYHFFLLPARSELHSIAKDKECSKIIATGISSKYITHIHISTGVAHVYM